MGGLLLRRRKKNPLIMPFLLVWFPLFFFRNDIKSPSVRAQEREKLNMAP
jgi:hypothetical protein